MEAAPSPKIYRFGLFELDARTGELRRQGVKIKLQQQPQQVLLILLERPGELVTREELRDRIWKDTFVDYEQGLNNAVKRLREALNDSAHTPIYIETLPRKGLRFIGQLSGNGNSTRHSVFSGNSDVGVAAVMVPVLPLRAPQSADAASEQVRPKRLTSTGKSITAVLAVLILAVSLLFVLAGAQPGPATPSIRSLAVTPFRNLSPDPNQEYVAAAMTEILIGELSRLKGVTVISSSSIVQYKNTDKPVSVIGRELNVDAVVTGSVFRSGDQLDISVKAIDVRSKTTSLAQDFVGDISDALTLMRTVARSIADGLTVRIPTENATAAHHKPPAAALETYLQGEYHLSRLGEGFSWEESRIAIKYFERAIADDPAFANAYLGLAAAYRSMPNGRLLLLQRKAAEQGLSLDPLSSKAYTLLADADAGLWHWGAAEREFRRAIDLNPSNAQAHEWLSCLLDSLGRFDEGMSEAERAQELDPTGCGLADAYCRRRNYEKSFSLYRRRLEMLPGSLSDYHLALWGIYGDMGKKNESIQELVQVIRLYGYPDFSTRVERAFKAGGYTGALREFTSGMETFYQSGEVSMPYVIAQTHAELGDTEQVFFWLEKAYEEHDGLNNLNVGRCWDPFRSDPRFKELVRRVGLPVQ